jgi:hypothetical protein
MGSGTLEQRLPFWRSKAGLSSRGGASCGCAGLGHQRGFGISGSRRGSKPGLRPAPNSGRCAAMLLFFAVEPAGIIFSAPLPNISIQRPSMLYIRLTQHFLVLPFILQ